MDQPHYLHANSLLGNNADPTQTARVAVEQISLHLTNRVTAGALGSQPHRALWDTVGSAVAPFSPAGR